MTEYTPLKLAVFEVENNLPSYPRVPVNGFESVSVGVHYNRYVNVSQACRDDFGMQGTLWEINRDAFVCANHETGSTKCAL